MYMLDMNQHTDRPENLPPIQIKCVHSSMSYQWATYENVIGVVLNRLVGMAL